MQVGPTQSMVNITTSRNVRDTCGIETGEHKRRNKRDRTRNERINTRSMKEGRESNIGTCTTKVQRGNSILRETYRGRSRD